MKVYKSNASLGHRQYAYLVKSPLERFATRGLTDRKIKALFEPIELLNEILNIENEKPVS
jgi:hypothetical protein